MINYELPRSTADYVHRIGRTGRAGEEGKAISLVSHDEVGALKQVEKLIGSVIKREQVMGYEASAVAPALPPDEPRPPRQPRKNNLATKQPAKYQKNVKNGNAKQLVN